ncbi:UvrD-helicase domain-containing protein [Halalkalicoccus salilacus]|uniref:UvrD-helicase domain-containing protein n=1 Tax=Halalkalicoccus sp. GCM10025704 TaxID=3252662 RepID=UPI0036202CF0
MSDDGSAYEESSSMDQSAPATSTEEFELTTEQKQALTLDQNIAITAGAGTGKTTTLTERYRRILEANPDLSPTQIVTITFTRDATSEMRDQIRDVVDDALESADSETYDRWQRAKDDIEDAYIHTIHGFCSRILEEYAVEAGVHPDFETLDNGEAATLIDRTVRDVLAYVLDEVPHLRTADAIETRKATLTDDVERLARLYSRDDLVSLLTGLLNERPECNQWANQLLETSHEEYVAAVFERACPLSPEDVRTLLDQPAVCEALETIRELAANDYEFTDEPDDGIVTLELIGPQLPEGPIDSAETATYQQLFLDFCNQVTTRKGALYARPTSYAGTASRWKGYDRTADHEALTAACETLIEALDPEDQDLSFDGAAIERSIPYVYAIARLYQAVRAEYRQRKEAQHALDYSDLIERTIDFLEAHNRARHELREQFEYIMVDEVQDTDPRQWELVTLLAGSDGPDFDGENVFLVGDEKQSIYRFRRADVTLFREARSRLKEANPESTETAQQLSGNFRTLSNPLTFINELFEDVFQPEGDEYQPYEARPQWLTPERSEGTNIDGGVEYLVVPETDQDVAPLGLENSWFDKRTYRSKGEREAYGVAARLTRLFADPPQIYDPDTNEYRAAQPRDVALLFRTRTRFPEFERAFEEYDIPYSSFGAQGFYETAEIQPLVNLLKVLQDPTQDIPLYGVLRSPLFGFTDEQLAILYDSNECLWEQLATTDGTLETAHSRLQQWRAQAGLDGCDRITTWAALLSEIIDDTGYLISIGADERPEQAVVNVNKFRERLRTWEEGSALPLVEVIERIERERNQETDPGEATIPTSIDGVQLRTVHSAKGLEFPIVVVPELSRGVSKRATITDDSQRRHSLVYLETVGDEPVLGIKGPSPANSFETTATPDYGVAKRSNSRNFVLRVGVSCMLQRLAFEITFF